MHFRPSPHLALFPIVYAPCKMDRYDWKYEGSKAGATGGGRTHTFGVVKPATRLARCQVYKRSDIVVAGGKPIQVNGN